MDEIDRIVACNLRNYLDKWQEKASGNTQTRFASRIGVSAAALSQWLSETNPRSIPQSKYEIIAQQLEITVEMLKEPELSEDLETAYVLVSYRGREATRSIDLLKHVYDLDSNKIVKEAAVVYGSKGGLLKLQATTQDEISKFLRKVGQYCDTTTTMFVMSDYQWQREQKENLHILDKLSYDYHPLSDFIERVEELRDWLDSSHSEDAFIDYFHEFFISQELKKAIEGELTITDASKLTDYLLMLAKNVKKSLHGLVIWDNRTPKERQKYDAYFHEQATLIKSDPEIDIQRIFVMQTNAISDDLLLEMYRQHLAGIKVFYMHLNRWKKTHSNIPPKDFGIFDNERLWVYEGSIDHQSGLRIAKLYAPKKKDSMIASYKRLFRTNLGESTEFGEKEIAQAKALLNEK